VKLVVTGALGHIGSRLIRELPKTFPEAEILLIDDLSTQRYCSLFDLPKDGRYQFIEANVLTADLRPLVAGADVLIHLAAITDATGSFQIKDQVEEVNYRGTESVAQACLQADCALIFPSTTSVYGSQEQEVDENCPIDELRPQSPYAEAKLKAEQLLQRMGQKEGLRTAVCRFGTIFGTSVGMRFHTAVNKFCWQAVQGLPLTVWRSALHQHRPYLDLGDAVAATTFIIQGEQYDARIYNVVTTNTSVKGIVDIISARLPELEVEYVDSEIMNQLSYHVLSERFRGLGFEYTGDLERGINATIDLLKNGS
jgi:UDP-glucose 4-epimerase